MHEQALIQPEQFIPDHQSAGVNVGAPTSKIPKHFGHMQENQEGASFERISDVGQPEKVQDINGFQYNEGG